MASVDKGVATAIGNIEKQTGKKFADWVGLARATGYAKHGEILAWLKSKHGFSHSYANFVAKEALRPDGQTKDELVDAQFAGAKSALKPIYDQLVAVVRSFGTDVEIAPKKNNVSVRRSKQFALLQPSTASRLDVGLILKGVQPSGRLETSGSFNAMFTHRVRLADVSEVDAELKKWLQQAYKSA